MKKGRGLKGKGGKASMRGVSVNIKQQDSLADKKDGAEGSNQAQAQPDAKRQGEAETCIESVNVKTMVKKTEMMVKVMISKGDRAIFINDINFDSDREETYEEREVLMDLVQKDQKDQKDQKVHLVKMPQPLQCKMEPEVCEYKWPKRRPEIRRLKQDDLVNFIQKEEMGTMLEQGVVEVTEGQKTGYVGLRSRLQKLKRCVVNNDGKTKNDHCCKLCGRGFRNGRELGGHMSRRHPGCSSDYSNKRIMKQIKKPEKDRRNYFKARKSAI